MAVYSKLSKLLEVTLNEVIAATDRPLPTLTLSAHASTPSPRTYLHTAKRPSVALAYSFMHAYSILTLSYDISTARSKASSSHSTIQCFLFQFPVLSVSLRPIGSCVHLLPRLPITSILPPISPSITYIFYKAVSTKTVNM